jgi:hypothetical protein
LYGKKSPNWLFEHKIVAVGSPVTSHSSNWTAQGILSGNSIISVVKSTEASKVIVATPLIVATKVCYFQKQV